MRQVKTNFSGDPLPDFTTWSKESPLFWVLWRTRLGGQFTEFDKDAFLACKARYHLYLDHTLDRKAREFAIHVLDRCEHFVCAKLSKVARDGEKILILQAKDNSHFDSLKEFAKVWGLYLHKCADIKEATSHEEQANRKAGEYLMKLGRAFKTKDDL
jgi:hypothetical protein